ncbi:MAG: type II secretion system protein [bacterium]|nr:type II secretion system protein [bacterium]
MNTPGITTNTTNTNCKYTPNSLNSPNSINSLNSPNTRPNQQKNGFTLLEILLVIMLTAILMLVLFQALDRVRKNEAKFEEKKDDEKNVYILYNAMTPVFKNTSSYKVFNNRDYTGYFHGTAESAVFLSKTPLVYPYTGLHFIEFLVDADRILYREKMFREEKNFLTFEELEEEEFYTLLEDVENAEFMFYLFDKRKRSFGWKSDVDTFDKDVIPEKVSLNVTYKGKTYDLFFYMMIKDKNEEIPTHILQ